MNQPISNLIKADLIRLKKDTPFKVITVILIALQVFSMLLLKVSMEMLAGIADGIFGLDSSMFFFEFLKPGNTALLIFIATSLFIGKDYTNLTIRTKLTKGFSRTQVYLSMLIMNVLICAVYFLLSAGISALMSVLLFGASTLSINSLIGFLAGLFLYLAFTGVATTISVLTRSKTSGLVLNILVIILLPSFLVFSSLLSTSLAYDIMMYIPYFSINILTMGITVTGQNFLACAIGGLLFFALSTAAGIALFNRVDIK